MQQVYQGLAYLLLGGMVLGILIIVIKQIIDLRMKIRGREEDEDVEDAIRQDATISGTIYEPDILTPRAAGRKKSIFDLSNLENLQAGVPRSNSQLRPPRPVKEEVQGAAAKILSAGYIGDDLAKLIEKQTRKGEGGIDDLNIEAALKKITFSDGIDGIYERFYLLQLLTGEHEIEFKPVAETRKLFNQNVKITKRERDLSNALQQAEDGSYSLGNIEDFDLRNIPPSIGTLDTFNMKPFKNRVT